VIQVGLIVESSNVTGAGRLLRGASLSLLAKFRRFRNADRRLRPSWPADLAKNGEFPVSGCKWPPQTRGIPGLFPGDRSSLDWRDGVADDAFAANPSP
jgi:hypothetical protein